MSVQVHDYSSVTRASRAVQAKVAAKAPVRPRETRAATPALGSPDHVLGAILLALVGVGTVMVFSSSTVIASAKFNTPAFFMIRHGIHLAAGALIFAIVYRLPVERIRKFAPLALGLGMFMLVLPLVAGQAHNGAQRWISIGGFSFQPSEMMKFALILFLADRLSRQQERLRSFTDGLLPHLIIIGTALALIVVEPDLSTAISIALIVGTIFVAAHVRARHLLLLGAIMIAAIVLMIAIEPYRMTRIAGFIGGSSGETSYQIQQGFVALGSGGVFGRGLGRSLQKYFFLPEPYTDSIFPIIGEEFGLLGTLGVLGLFAAFGWRAMLTIRRQPTLFRFLLATGLAANVMIYALLNIMVMTGLLPATGLPLPFISYGGTALLVNLAGAALLLRLSRVEPETARAEATQ